MKTDLLCIPGIGKNIRQDLINIGIDCVEALRGQDPEQLYQKDCQFKGYAEDRCQLYVFRCEMCIRDSCTAASMSGTILLYPATTITLSGP